MTNTTDRLAARMAAAVRVGNTGALVECIGEAAREPDGIRELLLSQARLNSSALDAALGGTWPDDLSLVVATDELDEALEAVETEPPSDPGEVGDPELHD